MEMDLTELRRSQESEFLFIDHLRTHATVNYLNPIQRYLKVWIYLNIRTGVCPGTNFLEELSMEMVM